MKKGEFNLDPWSHLPSYVQEHEYTKKTDILAISGTESKWGAKETETQEAKSEKMKDSSNSKTEREETRSMFRERLDEYANDTTLHGLKYAVNSKYGTFRRIVWAATILLMITIFTVSMVTSFIDFYNSDVSTVIKLNYVTDLDFPAITICNYNQFRRSKVQAAGEIFLKRIYPLYGSANISGIDPNMYSNFTGLDTSDYFEAAHQIEDMLSNCLWQGSEICGVNDFTQVMTDFGVCYTINGQVPARRVQQSGTSNGLRLRLDVQQQEYTSNENLGAGFRVMVHPQSQTPLVKLLGFAVSPGYETLVSMRHTAMETLPHPFPSQCSSKELKYYETYTRQACMTECMSDKVIEQCGCRKYSLPGTARICDPVEWIICGDPLLKNLSGVGNGCDCPTPCELTVYETKVSSTYWPSDYVMAEIQEIFNITNVKYMRKNVLDVYFYFEELSYEEIKQIPAYTGYNLQSDIGGFLGLYLGASLITVVEFLDFIVLNCIKKFTRMTKK